MTKFAIKFKDIHPKSRVKLKDKECTYVIVTAATQGESWLAEELGNREKTSIIYTKDIIFVNNDHTDNPLDKHGSSILDTSIDSLDQETFKDLEKEIENLSTEAEQLILHEKFENFVTDNSEELLKDSNEKFVWYLSALYLSPVAMFHRRMSLAREYEKPSLRCLSSLSQRLWSRLMGSR